MEAILELEARPEEPLLIDSEPEISTKSSISQPFRTALPTHPSTADNLTQAMNECTPLLSTPNSTSSGRKGSGSRGGTILGLHNLSIVLPQFFVALVAAAIFSYLGKEDPSSPSFVTPSALTLFSTISRLHEIGVGLVGRKGKGEEDVIWVLRFGGIMAGIGAIVSRRLLEGKHERRYREFIESGVRDEERE